MGKTYWTKRFALALLVAVPLLFLAQWLKGFPVQEAASFAALWGSLSAAIFSLVGYFRYRRNPACMLPRQRR